LVISGEVFLLVLACGAVGALLAVGTVVRRKRPVLPAASEDRERLALRRSAQFDRSAATDLRERLMDDLKRHQAVRRHLQGHGGDDPDLAVLIQAVDRAERATRQQLADIEPWLGPGR